MKSKEPFFKAHYDWLVAGVGFAALAASIVLLMPALGTSAEEAQQRRQTKLDAVRPAHDTVAPVNLAILQNAQRLSKAPPVLKAIDPKSGSFLASERRFFCKPGEPGATSCSRPIPAGAATCPFCDKPQQVAQKVTADTDGDGLPNDWEVKWGLNPNDAADAEKDSDGDGFTNAEEFAVKTNPTDKSSHADYLDYLTVQGALKQVVLPFWFKAAMPIPGGHRYTFQNLASRTAYDKTYNPKTGEEIGKTGWTAGAYKQQTKEGVIAGSRTKAKRMIDVSTVEIVRKSDGRKLELRINDRKIAVDTQATLVWDRMGGKTFTVKEGDEIDLNGEKYRVTGMKAKGKNACAVTLENCATKKQKTLEGT